MKKIDDHPPRHVEKVIKWELSVDVGYYFVHLQLDTCLIINVLNYDSHFIATCIQPDWARQPNQSKLLSACVLCCVRLQALTSNNTYSHIGGLRVKFVCGQYTITQLL